MTREDWLEREEYDRELNEWRERDGYTALASFTARYEAPPQAASVNPVPERGMPDA